MLNLAFFTVVSGVLMVGTTVLRIHGAAYKVRAAGGDVILVFGAAVWPTGPSPTLRARGEYAARLYRDGRAPAVLCAGTPAEVDALELLLQHAGVPAGAILAEEAFSTRATIAAALRRGAGDWRSVLAVSSADHMYRVLAEARRQGLPAIGCPVPRGITRGLARGGLVRLSHLARRYAYEVAAVWWYALSARALRP